MRFMMCNAGYISEFCLACFGYELGPTPREPIGSWGQKWFKSHDWPTTLLVV